MRLTMRLTTERLSIIQGGSNMGSWRKRPLSIFFSSLIFILEPVPPLYTTRMFREL
jgi:hypothetical protein